MPNQQEVRVKAKCAKMRNLPKDELNNFKNEIKVPVIPLNEVLIK